MKTKKIHVSIEKSKQNVSIFGDAGERKAFFVHQTVLGIVDKQLLRH